jgi:hypothetical protein
MTRNATDVNVVVAAPACRPSRQNLTLPLSPLPSHPGRSPSPTRMSTRFRTCAIRRSGIEVTHLVHAEYSLQTLRHSEHAHLLSNIEKLTLPIWGSMFPFWIPTGDLACQLETTKYIG